MSKQDVVITGIGILSAIGNDFDTFSENIKSGTNGIREVTAFDASSLASSIGGEVDIDFATHFTPVQCRHMDRCSMLAVAAARQALESAGISADDLPQNSGVVLGTTVGGMINGTKYFEKFAKSGQKTINNLRDYSFFVPGAHIVKDLKISGPNLAVSTACSSANIALGLGADYVRSGRCDIVLCGGVDALTKITLSGFNSLKNVSNEAIRPFDKDRSGVVLSEGAAIFCFEREETARARGAKVLAKFAGYGMSNDAFHMTAPDSTGRGPALAMSRALKNAGISPSDISHINAHGTATQQNDAVESRAIRKTFGDSAEQMPVTSTKSQHGHALGAAGSIEAGASVASILGNFVPPTININTVDPKCNVNVVANSSVSLQSDAVLSNNFAFGGNNCAIILTS